MRPLASLVQRAAVVGVALALIPHATYAQSVRIGGTTTVRYVEVGQWLHDSIDAASVPGSGLLRRAPDGNIVRCVTGDPVCRFIREGDALNTLPVSQDLTLSAWGLGRGVRVYAHLRGRDVLSGADSLWPRQSDRFDALVAYVEVDRGRVRLRAGRQWSTSGLGYYDFDGASALVRAGTRLTLQGYAGRSLVRGLTEPLTSDAVSALESFVPEKPSWLLGSQVTWREAPGRSLTVQYQREIRTDRAALYSERVAADAVYRTTWGQLDGTLEADLASRVVNESRLRARWDVSRAVSLSAWARTYDPFFELWTIWGAFSPVGFREAGTSGAWRLGTHAARIDGEVSYRSYPDASTSDVFGTYRTDGWRLSVTGSAAPAPAWTIEGSYRADVGFGAAKSSTSARVEHRLANRTRVGLYATAFQTSFELRVPEGTVWGLGTSGSTPVGQRGRASFDLAWYRHGTDASGSTPDWSQLRSTLRLDWTIGPEPGLSATPRGNR